MRALSTVPENDACAVCGKPGDGDRQPSHVYESGRRITLCGAECMETFLARRATDPARHEPGDFMQDLMADWKWRQLGR